MENIVHIENIFENIILAKRSIFCTVKLQDTATKISDALLQLFTVYTLFTKSNTNVFGTTLALVRYI